MRVLVTGGARPATAVVRSLGRRGVQVEVLAESAFVPALHSRYCTARHIGPPLLSSAFISALVGMLRRRRYEAILPVGHEATLLCAEHRDKLAGLAKLEIAPAEKVRIAADKRKIRELAIDAGVPVPRTLYPASFSEARALSAELAYPIVIKPVSETTGDSVSFVTRRQDFSGSYEKFCRNKGFAERELPLLQEFIPGYGCGFFALYQHGACKRIFMHRRIREYPPSGGVSSCAESFFDSRLKEYGIRLLDSLNWHGVAMVEFRRDERDGDFKLMEINPRFWGSLDLAVAAGVNFPYYLCQMIQGQNLEYSESYDRNLRFRWAMLDLRHVCRRPTSCLAVLRDTLDPKVRSDFWLSDLSPHLYETADFFRGAARSLWPRFTSRKGMNRRDQGVTSLKSTGSGPFQPIRP